MNLFSSIILLFTGLLTSPPTLMAQPKTVKPAWYLQSFDKSRGDSAILGHGVTAMKRRAQPLWRTKATTIAIIGEGIRLNHPQLKGHEWINTKEIPNDRIDNDRNGYVDDIVGWNFVGNKKAQSEYLIASFELGQFFLSHSIELQLPRSPGVLLACDASEFVRLDDYYQQLSEQRPLNPTEQQYSLFVHKQVRQRCVHDEMKASCHCQIAMAQLDRKRLVQDRADLFWETGYGNNNPVTQGQDTHLALIMAGHGTLINPPGPLNLEPVKFMSLRIVGTSGDYRDKDLANALNYAHRMGADLVILAAGKYAGANPKEITGFLTHLRQEGLVVLQAAGDTADEQKIGHYHPLKENNNLIRVGAHGPSKKEGALLYYKSNYGAQSVDLLGAGVSIAAPCADLKNWGACRYSGTKVATATLAAELVLLSWLMNKPWDLLPPILISPSDRTPMQKAYTALQSGMSWSPEVKTNIKKVGEVKQKTLKELVAHPGLINLLDSAKQIVN